MSQVVLLVVINLAGLFIVAMVAPLMTYYLNNRAIDNQTRVLREGQEAIKTTVEATHELVNGQSELLRAQREAKGYQHGVADAMDAAQLSVDLERQQHATEERNGIESKEVKE